MLDSNSSRQTSIDNPIDAMRLAEEHIVQGRLEQARRIYSEMLEETPDQGDVLRRKCQVEARQGRFLAALQTIDRVIELWPDDLDAKAYRQEIMRLKAEAQKHPYAITFRDRRKTFLDYPRTISIETVGRCNAKCNFCPAPELERRRQTMSDELFEKVIRDIQEIPAGVPININTNMVNEPFMDKKMFARIRRINEALPTARIQMYTNFNVMPKNFMEEFRKIRNLGYLNISFNAANEADYTEIMHVDFNRTVRHLKTFMDSNRRDRFYNKPIKLSRVADNTQGDADYMDQCRELFAEFEEGVDFKLYVKRRVTWLADTKVEQGQIPYFLPCDAWYDINIMCNGKVPLCCLDAEADYAIGDANVNSVLEIYNHPKFRDLRENHAQRESLNPCGECSPYAAVQEDVNHLTFRSINE